MIVSLCALFYIVFPTCAFDKGLVQINPSSQSYGPDGPWQTVNVSIGDPPQSVQLLPGGIYQSVILSNGICSNSSLSRSCGSGGLYDRSKSETVDDRSISYGSSDSENEPTSLDNGQTQGFGAWKTIMDQLHVPRVGHSPWVVPNPSIRCRSLQELEIPFIGNSGVSKTCYPSMEMLTPRSLIVVDETYITLLDGSSYPVQVGNLALGPGVNQTFTRESGQSSINASLIPGWFFEQATTANTYGLHIGLAAKGIPLSLWLGGYDRSRVLGAVSSQSYPAIMSINSRLISSM